MKFIVYGLIGLVSFIVTLALVLLIRGELNRESLSRLITKEADMQIEAPASQSDPLGPLAQSIRRKEEELKKKEAEIKDHEARLTTREQELEQLLQRLEKMQEEIDGGLVDADKQRQMRLETVAITLENMKPANAAKRLEGYPVEDAAQILLLVQDKERGKIIEAMDAVLATKVLREMQKPAL